MNFEKQSKIDMYKFEIAKGIYIQCEVDMNGDQDRVSTEFWIGNKYNQKKVILLDLYYKRCDMVAEAVPTLIGCIKLLLTEEYVWETIEELFNSSDDFEEFTNEFQPELTCELTE